MPASRFVVIALCLSLVLPLSHTVAADDLPISADQMRADVEFLSSDALAGRAPATRAEKQVIAHVTRVLKEAGCEPGNPNGTFVQEVPMYGFTVSNAPALTLVKSDGSTAPTLANGSEFVGWTLRQGTGTELSNADLVFVGYGVEAPEYGWNDYKDVDVRGKVIVMLVNDPPSADESLFGGRAMTYYGRWTYKFEKAAEKGAAGAILVHNTEAAGYPWAVVENSWSGEQFDVVRADRGEARCVLESWITEDAARKLFQSTGRSFDAAKLDALSRDFRPYPLGLKGSAAIQIKSRTVTSHNIVARVPGQDATRAGETILYCAHWDHLGVGKPTDGDSIYNGAIDNASGVAGVMGIARAFAAKKQELKRSVLFVFTTAEESGLLGSAHYAENPLYPLASTVAAINIDALNVWGRTKDMVVVGFGQSDLDDMLAEVNKTRGRTLTPDTEPEKGFYYRSDHFPFAKKGVPALYSDSGSDFRDRPAGYGAERRREYVAERYHKPQDELDDTWDLSGAAEDMTILYELGFRLATSDRMPQWSEKSEFKRVRDAMLGK